MDNIVYKIQRSDGLFATGSGWPRFNKWGKSWSTKAHLTSHLRFIGKKLTHDLYPYHDCKVVEFHLVPERAMTVQDFIYIEEANKKPVLIKPMSVED